MEPVSSASGQSFFSLTVTEPARGLRIDHYLAQLFAGVSRSRLGAALKSGRITVNGDIVKAGYRLRPGDRVAGSLVGPDPAEPPAPQQVDFTVLYEDPLFAVVDKPAGLVVHPGSGNRDRTLINGLLRRYQEIGAVGDPERPGIVHRLDKDTSGAMIVARTKSAHADIVGQFKNRLVKKTYLALVHGKPAQDHGRIVAPIGRHPVHRQKMAVRETDGRYAASGWRVVRFFPGHTLVQVDLETGRTHQIRVHLAHAGHPLAGDRLYGPNRRNEQFPRQMLHAWRVRFSHPLTREEITVEAPLAEDIRLALESLEERVC